MSEFAELRPSAFAIAYRMLGSVSEAEDVVQEGFLRLHRARAGGERIESPRAYLSTVVSRLSLDQLRSARVRRETYVGEWLPEPLITEDDPARKAEMADSVSHAVLVLLESLSPEQRAAFLLREVFEEPYERIAEIVGTSVPNARQLATRARRHVAERRPRFAATREQRDELANRFFKAVEEGDLEGLEQLLAHDVVLHGDGGGKVPAIARALHGRARVARTLRAGLARLHKLDFALRRQELNGQPGALFLDRDGRVMGVMILDVAEGQIQSVSSVVNPDKLRHLGRVADLRGLLRNSAATRPAGRRVAFRVGSASSRYIPAHSERSRDVVHAHRPSSESGHRRGVPGGVGA
jgi:RNA polymerase sigma-70 factor (ECF subfamily)